MKKLMIAAAIVCAAVVSQAATTSWAATAVKNMAGTAANGTDNIVMMYVFDIGGGEYDTAAAKSGAALTQYLMDTYKIADKDHSGASTGKGGIAITDAKQTWTAGDPLYAAVLLVDKEGNTLGNVATITAPDAGTAKFQNLNTVYGGKVDGGSLGWVAAPEPTSGLLLLLGVGVLALRRKRT